MENFFPWPHANTQRTESRKTMPGEQMDRINNLSIVKIDTDQCAAFWFRQKPGEIVIIFLLRFNVGIRVAKEESYAVRYIKIVRNGPCYWCFANELLDA